MGYYMRFFATDERDVSLSTIEDALRQIDAAYAIADRLQGRREAGSLTFGGADYGMIEVNRPGDGLFEDEIEEFKEGMEEATGEGRSAVLQVLAEAKAIVAVQVLWQDRETEETLQRISPLWEWLFANRSGLLQVDAEGWYDGTRLILAGT